MLDRSGANYDENMLEPHESFYQLFDRTLTRGFLPVPCMEDLSLYRSTILDILNETTVLLMWMVFFSCEGPFRYSELRQLKFAANERNIFVHSDTRCLQLHTTYNKVSGYNPKLLLLDKKTSNYVFYFIMILRPLQVLSLIHI